MASELLRTYGKTFSTLDTSKIFIQGDTVEFEQSVATVNVLSRKPVCMDTVGRAGG